MTPRLMRLGIRATILVSFGVVASLLLLYLALTLWNRRTQAETLAAAEAEHVASIIATTIGHHDPQAPGAALMDDPAALQRYVQELHRIQQRDIEVIGPTNRIVADVVAEDIGHHADGTLAEVAERVRRTGVAERFVEVSPSYPDGIRQIAVPLSRDGRATGVLVFEYTPLYDGIVAQTSRLNTIEGSLIVLLVALTLAMGVYIARLVGRESRARSESAQLRAVTHLANAAAHEINSPLTTVIGRLDMLADRMPRPSREHDLVSKAREASDRIGAMVANMQHITHLEYLSAPEQESLPATLDLKKSAGPDPRG